MSLEDEMGEMVETGRAIHARLVNVVERDITDTASKSGFYLSVYGAREVVAPLREDAAFEEKLLEVARSLIRLRKALVVLSEHVRQNP